jgi:hypothetical protein
VYSFYQVYWSVTVEGTGVSYQGTYLSTVALSYSASTLAWTLLFSNNLINERPVCQPSVAPSVAPTRRPTSTVANLITIAADSTMDGVSCEDVDVQSAFLISIANTLGINGGDGSSVVVTSCDDTARRRRRRRMLGASKGLREVIRSGDKRSLLGTALDFELSFILEENGFDDPAVAFDSTGSTLDAALADGSLLRHMEATGFVDANINITLGQLNLNSYSVTQLRSLPPTSAPSAFALEGEEEQGIKWEGSDFMYAVYGVAVGIVLLLTMLMCYRRFKSRGMEASKQEPKVFQYTKELPVYEEAASQQRISDAQKLPLAEMIVILIEEHEKLNRKLRTQLTENIVKEPALLRFILNSFDPSRLSKDHKKYLKKYLKNLAANNKQLWIRSVKEGFNKQGEIPGLLKVVLETTSTDLSQESLHVTMALRNEEINMSFAKEKKNKNIDNEWRYDSAADLSNPSSEMSNRSIGRSLDPAEWEKDDLMYSSLKASPPGSGGARGVGSRRVQRSPNMLQDLILQHTAEKLLYSPQLSGDESFDKDSWASGIRSFSGGDLRNNDLDDLDGLEMSPAISMTDLLDSNVANWRKTAQPLVQQRPRRNSVELGEIDSLKRTQVTQGHDRAHPQIYCRVGAAASAQGAAALMSSNRGSRFPNGDIAGPKLSSSISSSNKQSIRGPPPTKNRGVMIPVLSDIIELEKEEDVDYSPPR